MRQSSVTLARMRAHTHTHRAGNFGVTCSLPYNVHNLNFQLEHNDLLNAFPIRMLMCVRLQRRMIHPIEHEYSIVCIVTASNTNTNFRNTSLTSPAGCQTCWRKAQRIAETQKAHVILLNVMYYERDEARSEWDRSTFCLILYSCTTENPCFVMIYACVRCCIEVNSCYAKLAMAALVCFCHCESFCMKTQPKRIAAKNTKIFSFIRIITTAWLL